MTTARDIITSSLKKIGVVGVGSSLSAEDADEGLSILNGILGSLSAEAGIVSAQTTETFALNGSESYTIGSGGDFNTTIPQRLISAFVTTSSLDYPLEIVRYDEYTKVNDKTLTDIPSYIATSGGYPLDTIYIYPVGLSGDTLTIVSEKAFTEFANLDSAFSLSPEYRRFFEAQLAVEMSPLFEREASVTVQRIAIEAKQAIVNKSSSKNPPIMRVDLGQFPCGKINNFNMRTGRFV